jgi:hypothetical protein
MSVYGLADIATPETSQTNHNQHSRDRRQPEEGQHTEFP